MADYSANISVKVSPASITSIEKLEAKVGELYANLEKLDKVAVNPFAGQVTALKEVNKLLKSNAEMIGKISQAQLKSLSGSSRKKGSRSDSASDEARLKIHQESLEILGRQVNIIRAAAEGSSRWNEVMNKLVSAQVEMKSGNAANLTLIRTLLRNAQSILREERAITDEVGDRAPSRNNEASAASRLKNEIKQLRDFEKDITDFQKKRAQERKKEEQEISKIKKNRDQALRTAGNVAGGVGRKIDGAFGNTFSKGISALEGGAIRGATAALAGVTAMAINAASSFQVFGQSLDFLQGPLGMAVKGIADLTGSWGMAAVAAAALLPVLPDIGKAAIKGLDGVGRLGKLIADVTGVSERAKPALDSLGRSWNTLADTIKKPISNGLFGLGPNSLDTLKFPDLNRQKQASDDAFQGNLAKALMPEVVSQFGQELQRLSDRMNQQRGAALSWVQALEDGQGILKQFKEQLKAAGKALMDLGKAPPITAGFGDIDRETQRLEALQQKLEEVNKAKREYYGTDNLSRANAIQRTRDLTGDQTATQPALRAFGSTDQDVRIANLNDVQRIKDEIKRTASLTDEVKNSWAEMFSYVNRSTRSAALFKKEQAGTLKATQQSVMFSKLRLMYFTKQTDELAEQLGLLGKMSKLIGKTAAKQGNGQGGLGDFGENLALGVGFPLLFGGGPGSVIGSGIGSFFGKGFGGQIFGGAIGQIFDDLVAKAGDLGDALGQLNMDKLIEQGIVFDGQLQERIRQLNRAGEGELAEAVGAGDAKNFTGDIVGGQNKLAAGSLNELKKAWDGMLAAIKTTLGVLASPFIWALTAILRLVQAIFVTINAVVAIVDFIGTGLINWIGSLFGVENAAQKMYEATLKNTAEYEQNVAELAKMTKELETQADLAEQKLKVDNRITALEKSRTNGFTVDDRLNNANIDRLQKQARLGQEFYELQAAKEKELGDLREKYGRVYNDKRKAAEDEINRRFAAQYKELMNKKLRDQQDFALKVQGLMMEQAKEELRAAEAAEGVRRQGMGLNRKAEDLRLSAEKAILSMRRQGAAIEESAAELRRSIEDKIFSQQMDVAKKQLELSRRREQLALNEYDLAAKAAQRITGAAGEELGNRLLDSTREVVKVRVSAEADIAKKQKEVALQTAEIDRETKKFELDIAKRIESIRRAVADYETAAAQTVLSLSRAAEDLKIAAADYAVAKRKEEIALMDEAAARLATSQLAQQIGGTYVNKAGENSSENVKALVKAANELGISAKDLATIISYETGGTFNPSQWGGRGGNYMGLIQFGPEERRTYGVKEGMSFAEQVTGPVVRYLRDRFEGVGRSTQGASLSDLYRTVNGGNPNASLNEFDGNGTISEHLIQMSRGHAGKAAAWLGGGVEITRAVRDGTVQGIEQTEGQSRTEATTATAAAQTSVDEARARAQQAAGAIPPSVSPNTDVSDLLDQNRRLAEQRKALAGLDADVTQQEREQEYRRKRLEDLQRYKQELVSLKQPVTDILESQQVSAELWQRETELLRSGMNPELVRSTLEIERQVQTQLKLIQGAVGVLEARIAELQAVQSLTDAQKQELALLQEKLALLKQLPGQIQADGEKAKQGAANAPGKVEQYVNKLQGELNDTEGQIVSLAQTIESELSSAMSNAIVGLVKGTQTAQEAFATMFENIGKAFIDMATQMIAKALIMKALGILMPGAGAGAGALSGNAAVRALSPATSIANDGGFFRAAGGPTKKDNPYIVGERGPELFIPNVGGTIQNQEQFEAAQEAMDDETPDASTGFDEARESMNNVTMIQRDKVKLDLEQRQAEVMEKPQPIDVRYETVQINSVNYVTEDQLKQGTQAAVKQARSMVFKDLRNRPASRANAGVKG